MLKRAFEAKSKAQQPPAPSAKQLYTTSSQASTHDANIRDQFQRQAGPSSGFPRSSQSSRPAAPFHPRSSNQSQPSGSSQTADRTVNSKSFASLYNKEDSFKEEPVLIDLTAGDDQGTRRTAVDVAIFEDDFSDDDNLDLDYQCPSALPPPRLQATPAKKGADAAPADNTSTISWSQSSPSHLQPAQFISQSATARSSIKRSTPDDDLMIVQPVAKKRALPPTYQQLRHDQQRSFATSARDLAKAAARSPAKRKEPRTGDVNLTVDATKTQKKLLKGKSKKSATPGPDASAEEMHHAVKSYTVKQSAVALSNEQEHVKELVCQMGKSVFFTGPAGTGKSVLMRAIVQELKKKYSKDPERLAVTASTGLAACNIGGMTLHSFAGIGLGKDDAQTLVRKIRRNAKAKNRWIKTKVLIIDEISMVDGDLFDKLSQIGRVIRNNGRPWGGIQLVITGDFFQLPPVPDKNTRDAKFAFEAGTWNTSIDHTIGLTEVFRQKDPHFASMLNEMRLGRISDSTVTAFKQLSRPLHFGDGLEVTELFPTRNEVDNSNQRRLQALTGEVHRYEALDTGDLQIRDKLLANMMAPKTLELKKGAQVMLIKNLDETLVNGSLGTVIGFSTEQAFEASGGEFENDDNGDPVKKRVAAMSRQLSAGKQQFPLVQFHAVDGTARIMLCCSEPWKVELPTGEVQASREQLPLILAWALSIHKAQGQTLARVKVDLGKVFEKGQAYVALSRATTQEGLQVLRFDKQKVMAHPRVISFYEKLYSAESAFKKKSAPSVSDWTNKTASVPAAGKPGRIADLDDEEEAMASYAY